MYIVQQCIDTVVSYHKSQKILPVDFDLF